MRKRKYTKIGKTPSKYQCTKSSCKWEGKATEKALMPDDGWEVSVCPKCGNDEFYGLL